MDTLPQYTYQLIFTHRNGEQEVFEHTSEDLARWHFTCFGIEDADVYRSITLLEIDWNTGHTHILNTLEFPV